MLGLKKVIGWAGTALMLPFVLVWCVLIFPVAYVGSCGKITMAWWVEKYRAMAASMAYFRLVFTVVSVQLMILCGAFLGYQTAHNTRTGGAGAAGWTDAWSDVSGTLFRQASGWHWSLLGGANGFGMEAQLMCPSSMFTKHDTRVLVNETIYASTSGNLISAEFDLKNVSGSTVYVVKVASEGKTLDYLGLQVGVLVSTPGTKYPVAFVEGAVGSDFVLRDIIDTPLVQFRKLGDNSWNISAIDTAAANRLFPPSFAIALIGQHTFSALGVDRCNQVYSAAWIGIIILACILALFWAFKFITCLPCMKDAADTTHAANKA